MNTNQCIALALVILQLQPVTSIPTSLFFIMEHASIEYLAGSRSGNYRLKPYKTYIDMIEQVGVCMVDQILMENPLRMGDHDYASDRNTARASSGPIVRDGMVIGSPEACIEHKERFLFPQIQAETRKIRHVAHVQHVDGHDALKKRCLILNRCKE